MLQKPIQKHIKLIMRCIQLRYLNQYFIRKN